MKGKTLHYSLEQLNALLDGRMSGPEVQDIHMHMETCRECHTAFENLERVHLAIQALPVLTTRPGFTRSVMDKVLAPPAPSFTFRLLEKVSYLFGLLIVLGIMVAAFVVTGVFEKSELSQTKTVATSMADQLGDGMAASISGFASWLVQHLPFAFGKGSLGMAFFAVAVLVMLALVDRVVGKRVFQK